MNSSLSIFGKFLQRDFYIFSKKMKTFAFDYALLHPALYTFVSGYMTPAVSGQAAHATVLFAGSIIMAAVSVAFSFNLEFLFDIERNRFIEYQSMILPAQLVLIERIFFSTIVCFFLLLPFFPVSSLLLPHWLDFSKTSWGLLAIQLFLSTWFCTSLVYLGLCVVGNSKKLENLWARFFTPLFMLGGFQVPLFTMKQFSPIFGYICYFNPMIYVSEGIRGIILGGSQFIPYYICFIAIIGFSLLFNRLTLYYFKKQIDHI